MADGYCRNCGNELRPDDRFCSKCARPVHETAHVPTPEADVPVPPPPSTGQTGATTQVQPGAQSQGRSTASRFLIGCIGVFVVLFLLVAGLSALGGGGRDPEANQPLQGEQDGQQGSQQQQQQQEPAVEEPRPITLSGSGPQATRLFQLEPGLTVIDMVHQGDANFIVDLLDENGASVAPMGLANEIGPFEGSRAVRVPDDGIYLFSVQANGPWTIDVE